MKSKLYYLWHLKPFASSTHIVVLFISIISTIVLSIILNTRTNIKPILATTSGPNYPSTAAEVSRPGGSWSTPDNSKSSNDTYTTWTGTGMGPSFADSEIKIVKGGTIKSTNRSIGAAWSSTETFYSYGGATDKWGETWTYSDINASDFGVALSIEDTANSGYSNYLQVTNFGFSIPSGATIDGITVEFERSQYTSRMSVSARVDSIRISIDYSTSSAVTRYWVDSDGGNWNDTANWSDTSGGSGGSSVPVAGDIAIFDGAGSKNGNLTLDTNVNVGTLTFDTNYSGTITQSTYTITTTTAMNLTGQNLTMGADITASNAMAIASGKTLDLNGKNLTVSGTLTNNGTLKLLGNETVSITMDSSCGTIEYYGTSGPYTLKNLTYYNLKLNGASTTFNNFSGDATVNGTFNLAAGTFDQGTSPLTVKKDFTIASSGSTFTKSSNGSHLHFSGDLTFSGPSTPQNLGALNIGASPDTTNLSSDLVADSLTINAGDILNTKGYDLDIGGNISIAGSGGTLDTTDNSGAGYEGDGTIINVAGNFTVSSGGTFTKCVQSSRRSKIIMDGGATKTLTSSSSDLGDFQTSTASTHIDMQDNTTFEAVTVDSSTTLDTASNRNINCTSMTIAGTLDSTSATITCSGNWNHSTGSYNYSGSTIIMTETSTFNTGGNTRPIFSLQVTGAGKTVTLSARTSLGGILTVGSGSGLSTINGGQTIDLNRTATQPIVFVGNYNDVAGGYNIDATSINYLMYNSGSIPAGNYGTLHIRGYASANLTATMAGALTTYGGLNIYHNTNTYTMTFDTSSSNYALTTVGLNIGVSGTTTRYGVLKCNDSTVNFGQADVNIYASDGSGDNKIIADSADITSRRVWTNADTNGFEAGTSSMHFLQAYTTTTRIITTGGTAFYDVEFDNYADPASYKYTISGNLTVNRNLTLTDGQLDLGTNNPTVTVGGNFFISNTGTDVGVWTKSSSGITFNGTTSFTDNTTSKQDLGNTILNGTSLTIVSGGMKTSNFTLTAGTFDVNDLSMNITGNTTFTTGTYKTGTGSNTFGDAAGDSVTINGGTLEIESDATADITKTANTWTNTAGTISYKAGSTVNISTVSSLTPYYNLEINSTGSTYQLPEATEVDNNLTITAGAFYDEAVDLTVTGTFSNNGTLQLYLDGGQTISLTNDDNSGTVEYLYPDTTEILDWTYFNLKLNASGGYFSVPASAMAVNGNLDVTEGTFDTSPGNGLTVVGNINIALNGTLVADTSPLSVSGNWTNAGIFTAGTGTVTFDKATSTQTLNSGGVTSDQAFYNLIHSGAGTLQLLTNNINIDGAFTNSAGTFDTNSLNMTIAGDVDLTTGSFTQGTRTITMDGSGAQSFTAGGTGAGHTPYNLTITNASASGVTFADSLTLATGGTFTAVTPGTKLIFADGTSFNFPLININGSGAGDVTMTKGAGAHGHFHFIIPGTPTVTYVTVDNSDATGSGAQIDASNNCHDGTGNTYWNFGGSAPVNNSLTFTNPYSSNVAISDDTTEWTFEAKVTDTDGPTNINYVMLRMANSSDSTTPYNSIQLKWTESTDTFSEDADTQDAITLTSTGANSSSSGNQWTLNFKIKIDNDFLAKDTNYAVELYSIDDSAVSDLDNYADKYQVKELSLTMDVDEDSINLGNLLPGFATTGTTTATVTTNYPNGYALSVQDNIASSNSPLLHTDTSTRIADYAGTIATPTAWSGTGLGICLYSATGKDTSKWGTGTTESDSNNKYAGIPETTTQIHAKTGSPTSSDVSKIGYKLAVPDSQKTGAYSGKITVTATGVLN